MRLSYFTRDHKNPDIISKIHKLSGNFSTNIISKIYKLITVKKDNL